MRIFNPIKPPLRTQHWYPVFLKDLIPTEKKVQLETNQIKKHLFKELSEYIPNAFDEVEERQPPLWIKTDKGYVWYERPVKKKVPNVFICKNKASKISGKGFTTYEWMEAYATYHTQWHLNKVKDVVLDKAVGVLHRDIENNIIILIDKQSITNAIENYIKENL